MVRYKVTVSGLYFAVAPAQYVATHCTARQEGEPYLGLPINQPVKLAIDQGGTGSQIVALYRTLAWLMRPHCTHARKGGVELIDGLLSRSVYSFQTS